MGERGIRREQEIMDAATDAFARHGFGGVSMDDIAAEVGVTKPRIYAYFASKEDLYAACALRTWQRVREAIWNAAIAPAPPDVQLWRGICAYFDFIGSNMEIWRLIYPEIALAGAEATDEMRRAQREGLEMMVTLFGGTAAAEQPEGPLEEVVPMAQAFTGAATAIAAWWLDHPDEPKELQASRLMNFAWMGFANLLDGRWWQPPESEPDRPGRDR